MCHSFLFNDKTSINGKNEDANNTKEVDCIVMEGQSHKTYKDFAFFLDYA